MKLKPYLLALSLLIGLLSGYVVRAQTSVTNLRLRAAPSVRKVVIEYDLPQVLNGDSIYVELETASGRIIRPLSVNGDVGKAVKAGSNKLISWDVVKDNIELNENVYVLLRVARMVPATGSGARPKTPPSVVTQSASKPETSPITVANNAPVSVVRSRSPLPLIGWGITAGLAGYATVLALGLNKDADEYNSKPYADNAADLDRFQQLKTKIDQEKQLFTIVAGAAGVVAIANGIYTLVRRPKPRRTSLLIQSGNQITSVGLSRTF